ncbi:MAG TPA: hypothetical protein VFR62_10820 [Gemmatimonadales bacterium]|nr:hypothetical protein [Gemmatimonadales bacterium]
MRSADELAMEGLRALTDTARGLRMKAAHEKKRGVQPAASKEPAKGPAGADEDAFLAAADLDQLLKG